MMDLESNPFHKKESTRKNRVPLPTSNLDDKDVRNVKRNEE